MSDQHGGLKKPLDEPYCSFCGKGKHEVSSMIEGEARDGGKPPRICDECVERAMKVIHDGH